MGKNPTSNIKGLFLFEQNHLKNFTIPKRTPDKGTVEQQQNMTDSFCYCYGPETAKQFVYYLNN